MSDLVEDFLAREKDGLRGLENDIPAAATYYNDGDSFDINKNFNDDNEQSVFNGAQENEVPEKIKKWREEQERRLQLKDAAEEKAKEVLRKQAEKELSEWYKRHEETIAKTKTLNRNAEKECVAESDEDIEPGTEYDRISKLIDFQSNAKGNKSTRDNSRMRSIILQLKQTPLERNKA